VLPGSSFGEYGEGYLRLTYSNSIENILRAIQQIGEVLKDPLRMVRN
jgi:aspartate aminotransferase